MTVYRVNENAKEVESTEPATCDECGIDSMEVLNSGHPAKSYAAEYLPSLSEEDRRTLALAIALNDSSHDPDPLGCDCQACRFAEASEEACGVCGDCATDYMCGPGCNTLYLCPWCFVVETVVRFGCERHGARGAKPIDFSEDSSEDVVYQGGFWFLPDLGGEELV